VPSATRQVLTFACAALLAVVSLPLHAQSNVTVRIIAFNDFHGHLEPGENTIHVPDPDQPSRTVPLRTGGAAFLATRIQQLRAEQKHSMVVSTGDLIGASPLISGLFLDEPTIEVMNAIGIDVNGVGNHEFDRGAAELLRMANGGCRTDAPTDRISCAAATGRYAGAHFPFIAANIEDRNGKALFAPSVVREFDGIRIGFIGAVTRSTPGIVQPDGVAGLRFGPEAPAINREAAALQARGVQAIVVVIHEGGDAGGGLDACESPQGAIFDIERELDRSIDIVLSAHTHRAYNCRINGRLVIQGSSFGRLLSVVDVTLDRATADIVMPLTQSRNVPVPNGLTSDDRLRAHYPPLEPQPQVAAIVDHYRVRATPIASRMVGRIAGTFDRNAAAGGDHVLGRLIADAQLAATRDHGAVIAFTNPGGIRTELRSRSDDGAVNYADLYAVQPFGNVLVTLTLTGAQLKTLLEQQWSRSNPERTRILQPSRGFSYAWDPARPIGERVIAASLKVSGRTVDADRHYRVTVNDFLASGGDGFRVLRSGADAVGGPLDIDALTGFIRAESMQQPLQPDRTARIARSK
jgi:5'-nucleotidase